MGKKNPKVDKYIAKAQAFARPILKKLRVQIHKTCPSVVEDIKWHSPFYIYQDRILCATMGFKAHCAVVFWKGSLIKKAKGKKAEAQLKQLRRISSLDDLIPPKDLSAYLKLGMLLNEPSTKLPPRKDRALPLKVPAELTKALRSNKAAHATFKSFTPTKRKDYVYWIAGAKTEATRNSRIKTAVQWMAEGKPRNWKFEAQKKTQRSNSK